MSTARLRVLWLIPALLALHNLEEALTFERYLPIVRSRVPDAVRPLVAAVTMTQAYLALGVVTLIGIAVVTWVSVRPGSRAALWTALLFQAVMLLNVVSHVASAVLLTRGYAPGLATALVVNLPFSICLLRRARREGWVSDRALLALAPVAVLVHGPLLIGIAVLASSASRP